ncbi:hypothetical protein PAXRUDRAFT_38736, partial [Paxillus rubicundulus Ve08.2h10]
WGFSKQLYCQYPPTSKIAEMEQNVLKALNSGLNGKHQAAWANKKYHGHCVLPKGILKELD